MVWNFCFCAAAADVCGFLGSAHLAGGIVPRAAGFGVHCRCTCIRRGALLHNPDTKERASPLIMAENFWEYALMRDLTSPSRKKEAFVRLGPGHEHWFQHITCFFWSAELVHLPQQSEKLVSPFHSAWSVFLAVCFLRARLQSILKNQPVELPENCLRKVFKSCFHKCVSLAEWRRTIACQRFLFSIPAENQSENQFPGRPYLGKLSKFNSTSKTVEKPQNWHQIKRENVHTELKWSESDTTLFFVLSFLGDISRRLCQVTLSV